VRAVLDLAAAGKVTGPAVFEAGGEHGSRFAAFVMPLAID
jgi:hypothetical protein